MNTKNELKKLIKDPIELVDFILGLIGEDYDGSVGLRGLYQGEGLGELKSSYVWDDGNQTDEELDGTSAIIISVDWKYAGNHDLTENIRKYAEYVMEYGNGRIGLVVGGFGENGNDIGEIVISNAKVIYIWE